MLLDGISSLVDKSLLRRAPGGTRLRPDDEPRFTMLETIQEYALDAARGEWRDSAVQAQHAAYFLALAETAAPQLKGASQERWLPRLDAEHDNFRAALAWARRRARRRSACGWPGRYGAFGISGGIIAKAGRNSPPY